MQAVTTVAAYRERWNIPVGHIALGPDSPAEPVEAIRDRTRARAASKLAIKLSQTLHMPKDRPSHAVEAELFQPRLTV
jgi:hypothetical protein